MNPTQTVVPTPGQQVSSEFIHVGLPIILIGAFALLIIRTIILKVELAGPGFTLKTERTAVAEMLSDLLTDVRDLTREEKDLFMRIRNRISRNGKVTVGDLFADFESGSDGYRMLRSLQCSHLIRPMRGGQWDKDKQIQMTVFAERLAIARPNLFSPTGSLVAHE